MHASRIVIAAALALASVAPSSAKDCRRDQAPPGVRVPSAPGCRPANAAAPPALDRNARPSRDGSVDLGHGTTVRVTGRVRVEGFRR